MKLEPVMTVSHEADGAQGKVKRKAEEVVLVPRKPLVGSGLLASGLPAGEGIGTAVWACSGLNPRNCR